MALVDRIVRREPRHRPADRGQRPRQCETVDHLVVGGAVSCHQRIPDFTLRRVVDRLHQGRAQIVEPKAKA